MSEKNVKKTRRRVVTVAVGLGAFAAASISFAAFTTNSEPNLPGATGGAQHVDIVGQVDKAIFPGYCENVTLNFTNPNPVPVQITSIGNQGFRNVSDTAASESGKANRLEDFLYEADISTALTDVVVPANGQKTKTVKDAVCLSGQADDARQNKTFEAKFVVNYILVPGNEAN